jgi:uncharacterized protein YjbJ (UPF0337 family)
MDNDQVDNKVQDAKGKAKEAVGSLTDDDDLRREGRRDQRDANLKEAARTVGDAAEDAVDDVKKAFGH